MIALKWVIITLTCLFFTAVGVTWFALERSEVIELVTARHNESGVRSTNAWFVKDGADLLLEAGNPQNPWVLDIDKSNTLKLINQQQATRYCTTKDSSEAAHRRIRALMRAKYGWRDHWIDALFDVSKSALVKLQPC